ncbi:MAG TPA: hypothetical protein VK849_09665 [Longimicrobiales bacterium]|nr:hypothetical protein [Longimicrobiales bacterium]
MKDQARSLWGFAQTYAHAPPRERLLNRHAEFKGHPLVLAVRELDMWPKCLNDHAPIEPGDEVPANALTAEQQGHGITCAYFRR